MPVSGRSNKLYNLELEFVLCEQAIAFFLADLILSFNCAYIDANCCGNIQ
jgi:hypothetical protein